MKKASKLIAILLCVAMFACIASGCGSGNDPSSSASNTPNEDGNYLDNEPLRVGTMPHQMGVSLYYADKHGLFEEAGINVEVPVFSGGAAINEAIGAGELDGAISGLACVYSLANGLVKMVGEVDTVGSDSIVVRNDSDILTAKGEIEGKPDMYGSAETLRGKSFVCQVGQAQQFYALKYISQFGLTEDDITFINMEDAAGAQAFMTGNGDVISTKMPYNYDMVVTDGGYTTVATVEDATGIEIKDPVLFTPDAIENRRDEIVIFLQVIWELIDQWANDYEAYKDAVHEFYNDNGKEFDEEQIDYEFSQNRLLSSEAISSYDYFMGDGMQSVADFYGETGAIAPENVDNVCKNYDTSLLEEALGITVQAFTKE